MTVIYQTQTVSPGVTVVTMPVASQNFSSFDFHNDSVYECGISFGQSGPRGSIIGWEHFIEPHEDILDVEPPSSSQYTIGGQWNNGPIYLYFQIPGGGTVLPSQAPANEFTINAYASGIKRPIVVPLNRFQNIGNVVSTVGGVASSIQNDGSVPTTIIEATESGAVSSNVLVGNDGSMKYGTLIGGNLFKVLQTIANPPAGTLEVLFGTGQNGNITESRNPLQLDAGTSLSGGTHTLLSGSISRLVISGPFTVATLGTACAHGLGIIPDFVIAVADSGVSHSSAYDVNFGTMTSTNVTVYCSSNNQRTWLLSIKK